MSMILGVAISLLGNAMWLDAGYGLGKGNEGRDTIACAAIIGSALQIVAVAILLNA